MMCNMRVYETASLQEQAFGSTVFLLGNYERRMEHEKT